MPLFDTPSTLPASLFFPKDGYKIYTADGFSYIQFDLILDEKHGLENEVTSQPIERGSDLSIHIKQKLQTGSLTGLISNWSLKGESFLGDYTTSLIATQENRSNRAKEFWNVLLDLVKKKTRLKIVTALSIYNDVVITNVEADRDSETGDAQSFAIKFQQLNIVDLRREVITLDVKLDDKKKTSPLPTSENKATNQAAPQRAAGQVATQPAQVPPNTRGSAVSEAYKPGIWNDTVVQPKYNTAVGDNTAGGAF